MNRVHSPSADFARRGFQPSESAARIWTAWLEESETPPLALDWFDAVGDRFQALETLDSLRAGDRETFDAVCADEAWCKRVLLVAGASSPLAQTLGRHPETVFLLREEPRERTRDEWMAFFAERVPIVDSVSEVETDELRRANREALILISARDLSASDPTRIVDSIAAELAHVADAVLESSLALARAEVPDWRAARIAVIALGKTGGEELNYLSDVDVIYLAEPAPDASVDRAVAVATRVAAAQARICSAHTRWGTIWTVDAALRPEGKAGPLVRTLESCRTYYAKWAENWEFQAMLKARPAAGDRELGEGFLDMIRPRVWAAGERDGFLSQLRAMRERVIAHIPASSADREIKLSAGGLRDTEFSVQLLQLVHGRVDDRVRSRTTLTALGELVDHGYIGRSDGQQLGEHYRFQRVLEHRVQLRALRRTHLIPDDEVQLRMLARTLGSTIDEVRTRWRNSRRDVRRLRQRIFFSPLLDVVATVPTESMLTTDAAKSRMKALGFLDPQGALGHIQALTTGTSRSVEIQRQLMPAMLEWLADGPNPDFGLLSFRQLCEALNESSWYLRAMRDEGFMAQRLAKVASTSRYVVSLLRRAPQQVRRLASKEEIRLLDVGELTDSMRKAAGRQEGTDKAVASARALRRSELCRVALADVLGVVSIDECGRALSDIGSATIEAALSIARRDIDAPDVGIVALGRWGGREMSYSSDADCMFVVPDGTTGEALDAATRLVRRLSDIMASPGPDPALPLDSDLRPEGKGGPAVRTVSSYAAYYAKWGSTWERQMLLRARYGAGDGGLVDSVLADAAGFRYPKGGLTPAQVLEIRKLKSRMETERIPRGVAPSDHLKLGPGGLSDVEWTVQLLQLQHAHEHPELRVTSTMAALEAARKLGLILDDDARILADAWRHASLVRDAIMLVRGRPSDILPSDVRELAAIATVLHHEESASELMELTRRCLRRASHVVGRYFWGEAG